MRFFWWFKLCKRGPKKLDFVRWQGANRFKSGACTLAREHLEPICNTASGQKMKVWDPVLMFERALTRIHHGRTGFVASLDGLIVVSRAPGLNNR